DPVLWHRQLHPEDRLRWHEEFARTCSAGAPFRSIYRFVARDGNVVWVHGEAELVRDDDGRPMFLPGDAFDNTVIKPATPVLKIYSRVGREGKAEAIDWNRLFEQVRENLREAIQESGAVVTAGPLPTLNGVETQLLRVLQNLVHNAIKFRGERPITVHVSAER